MAIDFFLFVGLKDRRQIESSRVSQVVARFFERAPIILKIFLCHKDSKSFYAGDGNWVDDERFALTFPSCVAALTAATQWNLQNAAVLMMFDNRDYDILLPVADTGLDAKFSALPNKRTRRAA